MTPSPVRLSRMLWRNPREPGQKLAYNRASDEVAEAGEGVGSGVTGVGPSAVGS
jgi:hypothetical protein